MVFDGEPLRRALERLLPGRSMLLIHHGAAEGAPLTEVRILGSADPIAEVESHPPETSPSEPVAGAAPAEDANDEPDEAVDAEATNRYLLDLELAVARGGRRR